jgi:type I restriction enzyme S subunit
MKKLGDVFKISKGKKAIESSIETGLRYIQIGDLRNDNNMKYTFSSTSNVLCTKDDILIAWDGANAGTVGYNLEGVIGSTLAKLTPKIKELNSGYVGRFLQSKFAYLREHCTGATIPHLSRPVLEGIQIPLPPLHQQQKIANILDAADALRQNDKALVAKYDELTQALFLDMFGDPVSNHKKWSVDTLGNYCKKIQIGPFGSQLHMSDYIEEGIPLINPTNIKKGCIEYMSSVKISDEKYDSLPNYHLNKGDIVMARRGDLSKIGVVDRVKSFCGTGSLYLRLKENINSVFCYWLLSHRSTIEKLYEQAQGVTMANLNKNIIIKLPIVIPPIELQNQFAERIAAIEEQKAIAQASLIKSEELFNSLLQKAFKGELVN